MGELDYQLPEDDGSAHQQELEHRQMDTEALKSVPDLTVCLDEFEQTREREMGEQAGSLNIYQRINEVRKKIQYIKKDTKVQNQYMAVTHDAVTGMIRNELIEQCIIIIPEITGSNIVDVGKTQKGAIIIRYEAQMVVRFVNGDNPSEVIEVRTEAHANDNGDKATGKALSYGTKNAILKLFNIETGENDESRMDPYVEPINDTPAHKVQCIGGKYDGMELGKVATTAGRAGLGYLQWLTRNADEPLKSKAMEVWEKHQPELTNEQVSDELQDADSLEELVGLNRCLTDIQQSEWKDRFSARKEELKPPPRTPENARG